MVISMGNHWVAGVISERRCSSYSSFLGFQKLVWIWGTFAPIFAPLVTKTDWKRVVWFNLFINFCNIGPFPPSAFPPGLDIYIFWCFVWHVWWNHISVTYITIIPLCTHCKNQFSDAINIAKPDGVIQLNFAFWWVIASWCWLEAVSMASVIWTNQCNLDKSLAVRGSDGDYKLQLNMVSP